MFMQVVWSVCLMEISWSRGLREAEKELLMMLKLWVQG